MPTVSTPDDDYSCDVADGPYCELCGCELEWVDCDQCGGDGGWLWCPDAKNHKDQR